MPALGGAERSLGPCGDPDYRRLAWSPDGAWIAFAGRDAWSALRIELLSPESLERRPLTRPPPGILGDSSPAFSPDGATIVFTRNLTGGVRIAYENWLYQVDLWRVPVTPGGAPSAVAPTTDEWSFHPDISPDGSRVAFVSTRSGEQDVWVAGADGQAARRVTSLTNARVETPRWSPDGRRLVFAGRLGGGRSDVWLVDAEGGPARRLTSGRTDAVAPSWSRDGKSVYFGARPASGGPWQVWKLPLSGGSIAVAAGPGSYAAKESRDGRFLYSTRAEEPGIWRQPAGSPGAPPERVVDALAPEDWADWEPGARGVSLYRRGPPPVPRLR